jgi:hypothetical protein
MLLVKALYLLGIVLAAAIGISGAGGIFPWIVGGTGVLTGIAGWRARTAGFLITAICLIVALSAIREQPFNPKWLTDAVFFIRSFVAHVALAAGVLTVFSPQRQNL